MTTKKQNLMLIAPVNDIAGMADKKAKDPHAGARPAGGDRKPPAVQAMYVVGLDFGTTFSGFAWAMNKGLQHNMEDLPITSIYGIHDQWPDQNEIFFNYPKTSTTLYYTEDAAAPPLWGWTARLAAMREKDQKPWQHQHRFKLHLAGKKSAATLANELPPLPEGKSPVSVIADYLRAISAFAIERISASGIAVTMKDIKWCLTVPASWDLPAKQRMEEASILSGMITNADNTNGGSQHGLTIVLEPEAASIFCCRTVENAASIKSIREGKPYLIIDCGGGTVDLIVHAKDLSADGKFSLREVAPGTAGLCGGTFVDEAFKQFIRSKASKFDEWIEKKPEQFAKFMMEWEAIKRLYRGNETEQHVGIQIKGMIKKQLIPDADEDHYKIPIEAIKQCFDPTIDKVKELVDGQLAANPTVSVIFLVGGFAESPYLKNIITQLYTTETRVVAVVPRASEAILCGAVMVGLFPDSFQTRCMRETYGICSAGRFDPKKDPEDLKVMLPSGEALCKERFDIFVPIGKEIKVDEIVRRRFVPDKSEGTMKVEVWASSTNPAPRFANPKHQKDVYKKAVLTVKTSDIPNFAIEGVEVQLQFGKTVLEMRVMDIATGKFTAPAQMTFKSE